MLWASHSDLRETCETHHLVLKGHHQGLGPYFPSGHGSGRSLGVSLAISSSKGRKGQGIKTIHPVSSEPGRGSSDPTAEEAVAHLCLSGQGVTPPHGAGVRGHRAAQQELAPRRCQGGGLPPEHRGAAGYGHTELSFRGPTQQAWGWADLGLTSLLRAWPTHLPLD